MGKGNSVVKQYLLNADGSVNPGTNIQMLQEAGVVFVMPTTPPVATHGYAVKDIEPELVDGVWYQRWEIIEHPDANQVVDTETQIVIPAEVVSSLTEEQRALLRQALGL